MALLIDYRDILEEGERLREIALHAAASGKRIVVLVAGKNGENIEQNLGVMGFPFHEIVAIFSDVEKIISSKSVDLSMFLFANRDLFEERKGKLFC